MKRLCPTTSWKEEVPRDVWSYITNIYYHLKFTEQWQQLKLACASCQKYILPLEKIEIPLSTNTVYS